MKSLKISLLAAVFLLLFAAGCSSPAQENADGNTADPGDTQETNQNEEEAQNKEIEDKTKIKGTVRMLYEWPQDENLYKLIIEEFNKEYPNIKLEFIRSEGGDHLSVLAGAGETPELVTSSPNTPQWIANGLIQPLNPFLETDPDVDESTFYEPAFVRHVAPDGTIWGLPWQVDPNFVLVYNEKLLDQYGVDGVPEMNGLADFGDFLKQFWIVENGEQIMTTVQPHETFGAVNTLQTYAYLNGAKTETFYDPATRKVNFNDPLIVEALEWIVQFKKENIDADRLNRLHASLPEGANKILVDKAAVDLAITGWVADWTAQNPDLKFTAMPKESLWLGGSGINMVAGAEKNEATWIVLKWLTATNEGAAALTNSNFVSGKVVNPVMEEKVKQDPIWAVTYDILSRAERSHLESWVPVEFAQEFNAKWVDVVYNHTLEPKAFLDHMTNYIQQKIDELP
jgi:ABC-type glycerol-3-phosphate transport system substrate-binding protein